MIYTRFGSEVEITGYNANTGDVEIKYPNGDLKEVPKYELKADGAIQEIEGAIEDLR